MSTPIKIQLVLQGGGAKIVALMATLEALQELQVAREIEVTRIAGTSAGAMAGCLFAAGVLMKDVKRELKGEEGEKLLEAFKLPSTLVGAWKAYRGIPFWDAQPLREFLQKMLKDTGIRTLEDIRIKRGIDMRVVVTDLGRSGMIISPVGSSIVEAVLDSSGLPFLFRVWSRNNTNPYVDGGLCENLPLLDLQSDRGSGPVVVISFAEEDTAPPKTFLRFLISLLSASINNSMSRARANLTQHGMLMINSDIELTDFPKAFGEGLGATYELQKNKAETFFRNFITAYQAAATTPTTIRPTPIPTAATPAATIPAVAKTLLPTAWDTVDPLTVKLLLKLGELHEAFVGTKFHYRCCTITATLYSLIDEEDSVNRVHKGRPDQFTYTLDFSPGDDPLYCFGIGVTKSPQDYLDRTTCTFEDETGSVVNTIDLPIRKKNVQSRIELLYFFTKGLVAGNYRAKFIDESYKSFPKLLEKNRSDDLGFDPRQAIGAVGRINLILNLPDHDCCRGVRVQSKETNSTPGRKMEAAEIRSHVTSIPGFYSVGWTAENATGKFGIDIFLPLANS